MKNTSLIFAVIVLFAGSAVPAAEWGDLTATFTIDGKAPELKEVVVTKDGEVCGKSIPNDSLIVNPSNGGIANIIVSLYLKDTDPLPPIHEDYKKSEEDKVVLDNAKCRFEPHVCVARVGQTVVLKNSDAVGHNTKIDFLVNSPINPILPGNSELPQKFTKEERLPTSVSCAIHPWMTAKLVVKKHPYVGVTDKDGKLTIKNVPAGKHNFVVWQEEAGYIQEVKVGGKTEKWAKGRVEVAVKAGGSSLGDVKVPVTAFTKK